MLKMNQQSLEFKQFVQNGNLVLQKDFDSEGRGKQPALIEISNGQRHS